MVVLEAKVSIYKFHTWLLKASRLRKAWPHYVHLLSGPNDAVSRNTSPTVIVTKTGQNVRYAKRCEAAILANAHVIANGIESCKLLVVGLAEVSAISGSLNSRAINISFLCCSSSS